MPQTTKRNGKRHEVLPRYVGAKGPVKGPKESATFTGQLQKDTHPHGFARTARNEVTVWARRGGSSVASSLRHAEGYYTMSLVSKLKPLPRLR